MKSAEIDDIRWIIHGTQNSSKDDGIEDTACNIDLSLICKDLATKKWRNLIVIMMKPLQMLLVTLPYNSTAYSGKNKVSKMIQ